MPRGAEDYSNVRAANPLHRVDDHAELAARLQSIVTHSRSGSVLFLDSFTYGLGGWDATGYGTGAGVSLVNTPFRSGPFSCKMVAGTDGASAAKIVRRAPYPVLNQYGLEMSWMPEANTDYIDMVLSRMDGTNEHSFYVRYDDLLNELQIKDEDGNFEAVVEDLELCGSRAIFQNLKLVVDLEADEFVRFAANEEPYLLTDKPAYVFANADNPHVRIDIKLWGTAGANGFSYFDDVVLTQNEP